MWLAASSRTTQRTTSAAGTLMSRHGHRLGGNREKPSRDADAGHWRGGSTARLQAPAAPPNLPADVPRRDDGGNWLIYRYEEDAPAAVENARYAVNDVNLPWQLTYDPMGPPARRAQSTGRYQAQRELLQLTTQELGGGSGSTGRLDCAEYAPAIALEGGAGAVVTFIEAGDNRRAGSLMGQQFNHYYRMDPQPDDHRPLQQWDTFRFAISTGIWRASSTLMMTSVPSRRLSAQTDRQL